MNATTTTPLRRRLTQTITASLLAIALAACSPSGEDQRAERVPVGIPGGGDGAAPSPTIPVASEALPDPDPAPPPAGDTPSDDATEDSNDVEDDSSGYPDGAGNGGGSDGGGGEGGELDPFGDGGAGPSSPCAGVLATGATLLVAPEPAVLPSGTLSSALTVTNCGDAAVDWTAHTVPSVTLATASGDLEAGSATELGFTIDAAAHEPGAVTFKIKVSEPGHNHYVDVHAFRELVGSDLVGDLVLTAGEGAGGCANQCIVSGKLTGNHTTPNVTLEIGLDTPAQIQAWLSEQPPVEVDGHPELASVALHRQSPALQTSWTTTLEPLKPATRYYLLVAATDEFDHRSYRSGSFVSATPVEDPGDIASPDGPGGCAAQCITTALVTPQASSTDMNLHVETHTSALIDVWVSTDAPDLSGDEPTFGAGVDKAATTDGLDVTTWDAVIGGLHADTDYHVIVRASDLEGRRSYRVGTFGTPAGPQIQARFRSITIVGDGDASKLWNPGELSFAWGAGDTLIGTRGEEKISLNNAFLLPDDPARSSFVFTDDGGFLPTLYVNAAERDADGLVEWCTMGTGLHQEPAYNASCDVKVNVASSGLVKTDLFDSLPRCSEFELMDVADAPCLVLESPDKGDDYPLFWAVVSFEYID